MTLPCSVSVPVGQKSRYLAVYASDDKGEGTMRCTATAGIEAVSLELGTTRVGYTASSSSVPRADTR